MSAPVAAKGWCPGALRPMESGDGLIARIRPRGGRLSAAALAGIADLARRHGNGLIELTTRANIQLRGVTEASHPRLLDGLDALGLLDPNPESEAARNLLVSPFATEADLALAEALAARIAGAGLDLPAKFGFAVDLGAERVLAVDSADIRLERVAGGGLILRANGAATGCAVTERDAPDLALSLARWFLASGGARGGRGRMAAHLAAGARLPADLSGDAVPAARAAPAEPGPRGDGTLVGFAFGQLDSAVLAALARVGAARLTPWRMLLVEGRTPPDLPGLITRAADPLSRVVACAGAPACASGLAATRPLARALASHVPPGALLHVSGCAKGCAHPGAAPVTLIATASGFDLVRDGTASDAPRARGLAGDGLIRRPSLLFGGH